MRRPKGQIEAIQLKGIRHVGKRWKKMDEIGIFSHTHTEPRHRQFDIEAATTDGENWVWPFSVRPTSPRVEKRTVDHVGCLDAAIIAYQMRHL